MKHLSDRDYARLRARPALPWTLLGLCWCALMVMVLLWNVERNTAMRLRGHLVEVIELQTTWGVE